VGMDPLTVLWISRCAPAWRAERKPLQTAIRRQHSLVFPCGVLIRTQYGGREVYKPRAVRAKRSSEIHDRDVC